MPALPLPCFAGVLRLTVCFARRPLRRRKRESRRARRSGKRRPPWRWGCPPTGRSSAATGTEAQPARQPGTAGSMAPQPVHIPCGCRWRAACCSLGSCLRWKPRRRTRGSTAAGGGAGHSRRAAAAWRGCCSDSSSTESAGSALPLPAGRHDMAPVTLLDCPPPAPSPL